MRPRTASSRAATNSCNCRASPIMSALMMMPGFCARMKSASRCGTWKPIPNRRPWPLTSSRRTGPGRNRALPPRPVSMFIGCGHMVRLAQVREAGAYAPVPNLPMARKKRPTALRLTDRGWRIDLLPGVHVWHDKAWSDRDFFPSTARASATSLVMTVRRCPLPDLLLVLPLKLVSFLWFWIRRPSFHRRPRQRRGQFSSLGAAFRSRHSRCGATFWNF